MTAPHFSRFDHLRHQVIDEHGPGTVLYDFEALLDFIGLDGVRSTGKFHLLPMSRLFELDERLAKPLRPRLKRPQQQSFPHIHGLYLLLRATELVVPEGHGKASGRLRLDPAVLACWQALNATERYFTLLEAWLRHASWEAVGGRGRGWDSDLALKARNIWCGVPATGEVFVDNRPRSFFCHGVESYCTLALFELFGLFRVDRREPAQGENWRIERVDHTAFGDELLTLVFPEIEQEVYGNARDLPAFGAWQPQLQKYFPEWQNNLELPTPEFRDGTYLFKVSLGRVWRRIAVPAHANLESLAQQIIDAYNFDGDHLYRFSLQNRDGTALAIAHPYEDEKQWHTDEFQVGYLPLAERQSMAFVYDYGAYWKFDVKLEKVDPPSDAITQATVVESHGQPPAEYDDLDDDLDDDW